MPISSRRKIPRLNKPTSALEKNGKLVIIGISFKFYVKCFYIKIVSRVLPRARSSQSKTPNSSPNLRSTSTSNYCLFLLNEYIAYNLDLLHMQLARRRPSIAKTKILYRATVLPAAQIYQVHK